MHFIPEIKYDIMKPYEDLNLDFYDNITNTYQMSYCDNGTTKFLFRNGLNPNESDKVESMFYEMEQLGTLYIDNNIGNIVISNCVFTNNIGIFGGALTIVSSM